MFDEITNFCGPKKICVPEICRAWKNEETLEVEEVAEDAWWLNLDLETWLCCKWILCVHINSLYV